MLPRQNMLDVRQLHVGGSRARQLSANPFQRDDVVMVEDHLSALCETMRLLITGHDQQKRVPVATQRAFFEGHIASWVFACCTAIQKSAIANYYARVGEFTEKYMALDRDALAMDE